MPIPFALTSKNIFTKIFPFLPKKDIDFSFLLNPTKDYAKTLEAISELNFDKTYKTTAKNRHKNSDKILIKHLNQDDVFLDIGASDGTTSLDLLSKLPFETKAFYITDFNIKLDLIKNGNAIFAFNHKTNKCILYANQYMVVYPLQSKFVSFFFDLINFKKSKKKTVDIINPILKEKINNSNNIHFLDYNIFEDWKHKSPSVIKIANLLNPVYFNKEQIDQALNNIHKTLTHGGLLLVIDNRNSNTIEQSSLFKKNDDGFTFIERYNNGTDIENTLNTFVVKKKKLLFWMGTLQQGGAEKILLETINNLDSKKYEITLLLNANQGVFLEELRKDITYKYLVNEVEFPLLSRTFPIVSLVIRKIKIEVFSLIPSLINKYILKNEVFDSSISFIHDLADVGYKIKSKNKIIWIHAIFSECIKENVGFRKYLNHFDKYDKIVAISNDVKKDLTKLLPILSDKISTILNPINKKSIQEKSNEFYPPEFQDYSGLKLITIARINPHKGLKRLIDLKYLLDKENIKAEIFVLGMMDDKKYYQELQTDMIARQTKINFLGQKTNPYPYIKHADIMIHPSLHEGYGLVVGESLILNTPVIASDIKAFREFANNEITYIKNSDELFASDAIREIKKISDKKDKINLQNTNISDIDEFVKKIELIF